MIIAEFPGWHMGQGATLLALPQDLIPQTEISRAIVSMVLVLGPVLHVLLQFFFVRIEEVRVRLP